MRGAYLYGGKGAFNKGMSKMTHLTGMVAQTQNVGPVHLVVDDKNFKYLISKHLFIVGKGGVERVPDILWDFLIT